MGHPLRKYDGHDTWFITSRCFQARKLMTPHTSQIREVTGGVLARAARMYGVKLYAYAFLSNHFHLVIGARGEVVADFMKYLQCNLSKKLAPLCRVEWWGQFWERRHSVAPILDEAALLDRVGYVVAHGVKEGLVARASEWAGLHCAEQLVDGLPRQYRWYDWTRRWNARRSDKGQGASRWAERFSEPVELKLSPLPQWVGIPDVERCRRAEVLVRQAEAKHAGQKVLGMAAVLRESSTAQRQRKRGSRPWCHAASSEARRNYRQEYAIFARAFRLASAEWLRGQVDAEFPLGSFKPGLRGCVRNV